MKFASLLLALGLSTLPLAAFSQPGISNDEQMVLRQIETDQRAVYAINMDLTDDESRAFWPIYDEYEAAMKKVIRQRVTLLNQYADRYRTLSEADAADMLSKIWQVEYQALRIRETFAKKMQKVLPDSKALRYVQIQARIDNVLLGGLMERVPLAQPAPRGK